MRKLKVNLVALCGIALCGLLLAGSATPTDAQTPGNHPAYLRAIRDLRQARSLLQHNFTQPKHVQAASAAVRWIDEAIGDLKNASKVDEKSLGDVPGPKTMPDDDGRFHAVASLLKSAREDASFTESDPVALPYKDRALKHIENAEGAIAPVL